MERHAGRIREQAGGTPVVLFSAHRPEAFDDYPARGYAALIPKPLDLDDLIAVVRRTLTARP